MRSTAIARDVFKQIHGPGKALSGAALALSARTR